MHRFEKTMNIASCASQSVFDFPVFCTNASPGLVAALFGSSTYVAAVGLKLGSAGNVSTLPRKTGSNFTSSVTGASM